MDHKKGPFLFAMHFLVNGITNLASNYTHKKSSASYLPNDAKDVESTRRKLPGTVQWVSFVSC